jgi:hypothetical protein
MPDRVRTERLISEAIGYLPADAADATRVVQNRIRWFSSQTEPQPVKSANDKCPTRQHPDDSLTTNSVAWIPVT